MSTPRLLLLLVPLIVVAGFLLSVESPENIRVEPPAQDEVQQPARVSVTGTYTCLPHRDTSGPQTLECALGVRDESTGKHYSIDTRLMASTMWMEIPSGARIQVEGVMTPVEYLSSDHWQKYDMVGIISATSMQQL